MTRLIGLYPQTWRDRYEDEFLALLAERPPDPLDSLDIVRGAIDARLHPQVPGSPRPPDRRSRRSGDGRRRRRLGDARSAPSSGIVTIVADGQRPDRRRRTRRSIAMDRPPCRSSSSRCMLPRCRDARPSSLRLRAVAGRHAAAYCQLRSPGSSGRSRPGSSGRAWSRSAACIVVGGAAWRRRAMAAAGASSLLATCVGVAWVPSRSWRCPGCWDVASGEPDVQFLVRTHRRAPGSSSAPRSCAPAAAGRPIDPVRRPAGLTVAGRVARPGDPAGPRPRRSLRARPPATQAAGAVSPHAPPSRARQRESACWPIEWLAGTLGFAWSAVARATPVVRVGTFDELLAANPGLPIREGFPAYVAAGPRVRHPARSPSWRLAAGHRPDGGRHRAQRPRAVAGLSASRLPAEPVHRGLLVPLPVPSVALRSARDQGGRRALRAGAARDGPVRHRGRRPRRPDDRHRRA